jgi:hypothetical protein
MLSGRVEPKNFAMADPSFEKKGVIRTCFIEKGSGLWTFHLLSTEYDNFNHIPYNNWRGTWKESLPMQTKFSVPDEHAPFAETALKKMGYTVKAKKEDRKALG